LMLQGDSRMLLCYRQVELTIVCTFHKDSLED
jgi:hypothetical protein